MGNKIRDVLPGNQSSPGDERNRSSSVAYKHVSPRHNYVTSTSITFDPLIRCQTMTSLPPVSSPKQEAREFLGGLDAHPRDSKRRRVTLEGGSEKNNGKTDANSKDAPQPTGTPLIPPEIWNLVVTGHLPYQDVMSLAATCRPFRNEVLPLMQKLILTRPKELHLKHARRFQTENVKQIRILSYVRYETWGLYLRQRLCGETAGRLVPYLMQFPKLEHAVVGGKLLGKDFRPMNFSGTIIQPNEDVFRCHRTMRQIVLPYTAEGIQTIGGAGEDREIHFGLVRSLCGAFACGALPPTLHIHGLLEHYRCEGGECKGTCRLVLKNFPISHLEKLLEERNSFESQRGRPPESRYFASCLTYEARLDLLASRSDTEAYLTSPKRHHYWLRCFYQDDVFNTENHTLDLANCYMPSVFDFMETLRDKHRCDPSKVTIDDLKRYLPPRNEPINFHSHQRLMEIGFCIPKDYFSNVLPEDY